MGSSRYGNQKSYRSATPSRQLALNFVPRLISLLIQLQTDQRSKVIERVVNDMDKIFRLVRFPDWQQTSADEQKVKKALQKMLFRYQLYQDTELTLEKANGYIEQYY